MKTIPKILLVITTISLAADFISTKLALATGIAIEWNPLYHVLGSNVFFIIFIAFNALYLAIYIKLRSAPFVMNSRARYIMDVTILTYAIMRYVAAYNNLSIIF